MHRGHEAIVQTCVEESRGRGLVSVALTFEPHPALVLTGTSPARLQSQASRTRALQERGIERVHVLTFDHEMAQLSPGNFISRVLIDELGAATIVVGVGFRFGSGRAGSSDSFRSFHSSPLQVVEVPPVHDNAGRVSSTRVREALAKPDLAEAERLLGRTYEIAGSVMRGDARGRTLGFPTANVALDGVTALAHGVYAGTAITPDGLERRAAINVGVRPTVGGGNVLSCEAHLIDFNEDLYGMLLRLRIEKFLRREIRFKSLDELRDQITKDVALVRSDAAASRG